MEMRRDYEMFDMDTDIYGYRYRVALTKNTSHPTRSGCSSFLILNITT